MEKYCLECHSADVSGADRMAAPADENFDSLSEIQEDTEKLKAEVSIDKTMPFPTASNMPSDAEREQFAKWMDCGAP
jgi:uncharacterized membrane protein